MKPAVSRYLGLAGSCVIALAAFLAGARQTGQPGPLSFERIASQPRYAFGCAAWVVGIAVLLCAWWLARRHTNVRWMLTTAALWSIPLLLAPPIASRDVYAYANQGDMYAHGMSPYADGPGALPTQWLNQMDDFWQTEPTPYGPLFLMIAAAVATLAGGSLTAAVIMFRLIALAAVLACVYMVPKLARHCGVGEASTVWLGLAAPLTLVHLLGGMHNDALMLALILAACVCATRQRPYLTGIALGAAVAVKATALVVAPFAVLLLLPVFTWKALWNRGIRVFVATLGCFGVITLASGLGLGWVEALAVSGKSVSWLSLPTGLGIASAKAIFQFGGTQALAEQMVPLWRGIGLAVAAVAVVVLWWRARNGPPAGVVAAAGWAMATVVVLGPVLLSWYAIVPLLLLACATGNRRLITGLACAATALAVIVLPDGHNAAAEQLFKVGLVLDIAAAVAIVVWLVRRLRIRPRALTMSDETAAD